MIQIFQDNSVRLLIYLNCNWNKIYGLKLSRELNVTPSTINNIVLDLENIKLIKTEKEGRKRFISLTDKGKVIANKLMEIKHILEK
jgi:Mn-dependent DtxR family transcriptional regulator